MNNLIRTPFASALAGGLVVGVLGWVAIAAGWVEAEDGSDGESGGAVTLASPASDRGEGEGLSVNEIYNEASPGVAFIEADVVRRRAFTPFGPPSGGGGTATGSGFVIDDDGR